MCGIAGILGQVEKRDVLLKGMLDSMRTRGPDNHGDYFDDSVCLGHRRLKVIDLTASGNQPMANEGDNLWVVHNGEIYNFKELRRRLEESGHIFRSQTDTEVILHGYEEWGRDCLKEFRGMFAFAIWDKNKKELFLARDRIGIKPVYYYFRGNTFVFASQVRSIMASGLVSRKISPRGLETYLECGGLREPWTILEDVYSLPAGHYAIWDGQGLKIEPYWDLSRITLSANPYSGVEEIYERINLLLEESMRLHLFSDAPLGLFLSGGIDSSSLASIAAETAPGIKSISLVFREKTHSEADYSRLAAKVYHTDHQEVLVDNDYVIKHLTSAIEAMDEPTFNGINTYFVSRAARELGLTVALSGLGADELFAGYTTFRRINKLIFLGKLWHGSPDILKNISVNILKSGVFHNISKDKLLEFFQKGFSDRHPYFWMRRLFTQEQANRLLKTQQSMGTVGMDGLDNFDTVNQISILELGNYMKNILLRDTDFMSMAHSLEVRVPFLDHELVEFMLSLPGNIKMSKNQNKPLLINSLKVRLPESIIRRRKMGFVFPFEVWLGRELRPEMEEAFHERNSVLDELLQPEAVRKIWEGFIKGRVSWQRPWALYVLKKWIKFYLS